MSLWGRRPCRPGVPILVKKPPRVAPTVSTRRAMLVYVALDSLESLDRDAHIKLCFNLDIANSRQLPGSARGALRWDSTPWGVRAAPSSSLPFRGSLYSLRSNTSQMVRVAKKKIIVGIETSLQPALHVIHPCAPAVLGRLPSCHPSSLRLAPKAVRASSPHERTVRSGRPPTNGAMAAVSFGAAACAAGVTTRRGEAASCSGMGGASGGHRISGGAAVTAAGGKTMTTKRAGGGGARRGGAQGGSARAAVSLSAAAASVAGAGAGATGLSARSNLGAAALAGRGCRHRQNHSGRGLGLVAEAVAVNRSTKSLDELDPERVKFASHDELDYRCALGRRTANALKAARLDKRAALPSGITSRCKIVSDARAHVNPTESEKKQRIGPRHRVWFFFLRARTLCSLRE